MSPGPEQLGADGVPEHDLAREHAVGDQQPEVQRVGVGQPAAIPFADGEGGDPHPQFVLGGVEALGVEQRPEFRIEVEQ